MTSYEAQLIRDRIRQAGQRELDLPEKVARDVAFHMTDWLDDLTAFHRFCADPEALTDQQLADLLMAFLVHVPNHLAAAAKLYTGGGVTDIFGVDATKDDDE
jgi:hypothetical protein